MMKFYANRHSILKGIGIGICLRRDIEEAVGAGAKSDHGSDTESQYIEFKFIHFSNGSKLLRND